MNKRAQVAETITWVVATIIITLILITAILVTSAIAASGNTINGGKTVQYTNKFDIFADKSLTAYLMTKDSSGSTVYNEINNEGQLNSFNGNLAQQIFSGLYSGYYRTQVFLGIAVVQGICPLFVAPDVFGSGYCTYNNGYLPISGSAGNRILDDPGAGMYIISLINNKYLQMVLWH